MEAEAEALALADESIEEGVSVLQERCCDEEVTAVAEEDEAVVSVPRPLSMDSLKEPAPPLPLLVVALLSELDEETGEGD